MKKCKKDQIIVIKVPADPSKVARVIFSPGPLQEEALRLVAEPGSGWDKISSKLTGKNLFLINRKLAIPKSLNGKKPNIGKQTSENGIEKDQPSESDFPMSVDEQIDELWGGFVFSQD